MKESLGLLSTCQSQSIDVIYIDPPFNTGKIQSRARYKTSGEHAENLGEYDREIIDEIRYDDIYGSGYISFLRPRIQEAFRVLKNTGTFYLHLNYKEVHYAKVLCDLIFGRDNFVGEIIWAYDWGGYSKCGFPMKHQTILHYAKDIDKMYFDFDKVERVPYLAPELVSKEKAKAGKPVKSVWWISIVNTVGKEKTGYPNQKPVKLLRRLLSPVVKESGTVLDFFAGSGTTGEVALELGADVILSDNNKEAVEIMRKRLCIIKE